jgi:hypothetical protein
LATALISPRNTKHLPTVALLRAVSQVVDRRPRADTSLVAA